MAFRDTSQETQLLVGRHGAPAPHQRKKVRLDRITKLHKLLALALDDFEQVLRDDRYVANMKSWHDPRGSGKCHVCLAGSVMAKSLGWDIGGYHTPGDAGERSADRLAALNALRCGSVDGAWRYLHSAGKVPPLAEAISARWRARLCRVSQASEGSSLASAQGRVRGRRLLKELRIMQQELEQENL